MPDDLIATRERITAGSTDAPTELEHCLERLRDPGLAAAFLQLDPAAARTSAAAAAASTLPLAGLAISVKDLYDVAGQVSSAGSTVLADAAPAAADAPAVARVRAAGATLLGRTHMSEFAFSGVGLNPHHATPANVPMRALDPARPCVPGGSSSGAATSVAGGIAFAALGSDTGGSIRIPAALQGLVGFKSTARLVPTTGMVPLSTTLDTACAITRSVRDAVLLHEILAARRVRIAPRAPDTLRALVPTTLMLDELEPAVAHAFEQALSTLRTAGMQIDQRPLPALDEVARINARGGFSAAEAWSWHRELIERHESRYDPRVALRIRRGAAIDSAAYAELQHQRTRWIASMTSSLAAYDLVLSPTVPILAPALAPLQASDEAFFRHNALLLRNPSVVNLLDGCALSLPCHAPGTPPVGLMLWAPAMHDDALLSTALQIEALLAPTVVPERAAA
ncbi:amidase [Rivibacter subsaxonicus]|uniref:Amidase/aspartyl-tRNA(Asn)/glutamyl-tRNA(Gln) amidotransferase subunit A n=1 Tax=Rivibacter subsaxonicus TaxID=457575 RepID=A0A4Q7VAD1_9BURK|nr:amidase [Rivibacter subsaxonicus]RZT92530.1 amidase/aspartyl-tRNA(Asn)/glutamyl-tRNA(Gln) amidotransferase subunit A [Rivibacter subsaxonicus]